MSALFLKIPGLLRTAASVVSTLAALSLTLPILSPYTEALTILAGLLGGAGVGRAGVRQVIK